jgi:hypothetical protein
MEIKNPFKPKVQIGDTIDFKDHSDGARKFLKEELEKEDTRRKLEELHPEGSPAMSSEIGDGYQAELKGEKIYKPATKFDVKIAEEDLSITQKGWSTLVAQIFLETFNAEKSLLDIATEVRQILANQGIEVNIDDIHKIIDESQSRMLKLSISKTLAYAMGLTKDWDAILQREMDLIYPQKKIDFSSKPEEKR